MSDNNLKSLEAKIDELIAFSAHLRQENGSLKDRENSLLKERTQLIEKTNLARQRVEAMITKLKALQDNA
jgi:cell division protein ZapB